MCLIVLMHQIIEITNIYLNFPFEIKLDVSDYNGLNLPSISFCSRKGILWQKLEPKSKSNKIYSKKYKYLIFGAWV